MGVDELHDNLIHRMNVGDILTRTACRYPDRTAIVEGACAISYAALNASVNRTAAGLTALGFGRGDALAIASGNSADFLRVYYACAKLGVVCVPLNTGWQQHEAAHVLRHSRARCLVVESQLVASMAGPVRETNGVRTVIVLPGTGAAWAAAPPDRHWMTVDELVEGRTDDEPEVVVGDRDPVTYLYTSGTTTAPKGVECSHLKIVMEAMTTALEVRYADDDRYVVMLPMFHVAMLTMGCNPIVLVGGTLYILRGFDAGTVLELVERERITQIFGLPAMYQAMLDHPDIARRDPSSLRRAGYAMAPMPDAQLRQCLETFRCEFYLAFGQTEIAPATLFRPEHQLSHTGAVGTPTATTRVAVMGPDGRLCGTGEEGEIVYRGPGTLTGYLHDDRATATAFEHGWFHSGDVGVFDADGILWFRDRYKDVIKSGGENVASIEVEKAVYAADPDVGEVAVVGLPHPRWAEAVTAVVVPRPGRHIDPDRLLGTARGHLSGFKAPKAVIVVDELPHTSTGKIQKHVLRDRYLDYFAAGAMP